MLLRACAPQYRQRESLNILTFEEGLYGFERIKRYMLSGGSRQDSPFLWLQAVDENLCIAVIDPRIIVPDYDFELSDVNMRKLGATQASQFVVLSIVALRHRPEDTTVNLKSPIVINTGNLRGMQLILDDEEYPIRYRFASGERRSVAHAGHIQENR